eukprot:11041301-Lingulodinium_polyedra.AAC.1
MAVRRTATSPQTLGRTSLANALSLSLAFVGRPPPMTYAVVLLSHLLTSTRPLNGSGTSGSAQS